MKRRAAARGVIALLALVFSVGMGRPGLELMAAEAPEPGEFILCAAPDRIAAIASRHGLTIIRQIDGHPNVFLVRKPMEAATQSLAAASDAVLNELHSDPDVDHFDANGPAIIAETQPHPQLNDSTVAILDSLGNRTSTAYFGTDVWSQYVGQPAMAILRLPDAQRIATGAGIVVAIIDTGVDPRHPALAGSLVPGYDFTRDTAGPASEWLDLDDSTVAILDSATVSILDANAPVSLNDSTVAILDSATTSALDITRLPAAFGHGTMVAGLVHVVAPGARIMPLKAFRADGTSNLFDIERAIYYAVDHGAKVINMSFSMLNSAAEITHAIDYASQHGVITLASVGNTGRSALVYPAAFRNVIGVGSTSLADERSTFTNFGDHLVKFAAPGERLITLYPGRRYAGVAGTSFSVALVTGGTVLMSQVEPALDQRLASRYFDDGAMKKPDWELGDGRINLYESLRAHAPAAPPPPPDTTAPSVTLMSPSASSTVTGIFPLVANASDNVGVAGVQFTLDGFTLGESTGHPFQVDWDSTTAPSGAHLLKAVARDAAGNQSETSVTITVSNDVTAPTVTVTGPADGATVTGTIAIGVTASDNVGVVGVQFKLDGANLGAEHTAAPYELSWNSATVPNGAHVLAAVARDAAGNQRTSSVNVTVANDATAPSVMVTNPGDAAIVFATVMIGADASDDNGVVSVQFLIDDVNLGAEITTAPYELAWESSGVANGAHVLKAVARDAAGNQQTASVSLVVANLP